MEIFALFMLCGAVTTLFIPETKRKTLEELAGEVPGTANYDPTTAGHLGQIQYRASDEETPEDPRMHGREKIGQGL